MKTVLLWKFSEEENYFKERFEWQKESSLMLDKLKVGQHSKDTKLRKRNQKLLMVIREE